MSAPEISLTALAPRSVGVLSGAVRRVFALSAGMIVTPSGTVRRRQRLNAVLYHQWRSGVSCSIPIETIGFRCAVTERPRPDICQACVVHKSHAVRIAQPPLPTPAHMQAHSVCARPRSRKISFFFSTFKERSFWINNFTFLDFEFCWSRNFFRFRLSNDLRRFTILHNACGRIIRCKEGGLLDRRSKDHPGRKTQEVEHDSCTYSRN